MDYTKLVLAFAGTARSGKTTAADIAVTMLQAQGFEVEKMSFAGPLKDGLKVMGLEKEDNYELYRYVAQQVGTNMLRAHSGGWWTDLMKKNIDAFFSDELPYAPRAVIIDDVRFENESELVNTYGQSKNIFVYGGQGRIDLSLEVYDHASEKMGVYFEKSTRGIEVEPFGTVSMDRILDNTGSLKNLEDRLADMIPNIVKNPQSA